MCCNERLYVSCCGLSLGTGQCQVLYICLDFKSTSLIGHGIEAVCKLRGDLRLRIGQASYSPLVLPVEYPTGPGRISGFLHPP